MLFQSLDKLKRQSILAAILMMALGVIMLICPESYVNTLVVTAGYASRRHRINRGQYFGNRV